MYEPDFAWPAGFRPYESRLYVRNRLDMDASVEAVWSSLVAAPLWPTWFPNATAVALPAGRDILEASMKFSWSQSGVRLASDVREHARLRRLAWFAKSPWIQAYHAWDLTPSKRGCFVTTDETQHGIMPAVLGPLLKRRMLELHDRWLRDLEARARELEA